MIGNHARLTGGGREEWISPGLPRWQSKPQMGAQRCRDGGRVVNVCTAIATAVNADGQREILGVDVFTAEDGAAESDSSTACLLLLPNAFERGAIGLVVHEST